MLFIDTRDAGRHIASEERLGVLERLQDQGLTPLIRTARLHCYEMALLSTGDAAEMEQALAHSTIAEVSPGYLGGEIFCFDEYMLFLVFGDEELRGLRAGIVYTAELTDPLERLDAFCQNVSQACHTIKDGGSARDDNSMQWGPPGTGGSARLRGSTDRRLDEGGDKRHAANEWKRAMEVLEDPESRRLLGILAQAHSDERTEALLAKEEDRVAAESRVNRMVATGLLRREILISCRRVGRALFRLPSADTLSSITSSQAVCSECGAAVADERVDALILPTEMASELLNEGAWLASRMKSLLLGMGIPEDKISIEQPAGRTSALIKTDVCGQLFLFALADGDLSAGGVRHAMELLVQANGAYLVIVAMGKVDSDARGRLRDFARRRTRAGRETEAVLYHGMASTAAELPLLLEQVSQKALERELYPLDADLGLNAGYFVATRFRLMRKAGMLEDLAQSAVGALAGSLGEI
jgi:hypothetical protein